jgi:hypothetical protein
MPRDANGNYTLPAGNPVVSGEVVAASWANNTMNDLGTEMGLSLDRQGRGGMLAPFRHADGTVGGPAITFTNEPTTGLYRAGAADLRVSIAGTQRMRWTSSGAEIWDPVGSAWINLGTTLASLQTSITTNTTDIDAIEAREANYAKTNAQNIFNTHQLIQNASGTWNVYKDSPTAPSKATRFGLLSDYTKLEHYDGANWYPVVVSNALETWLQGDALVLATKGGTQMNVVGSAEFRHYYGQAAVFYNAAQTKSSSLLQFNNDFFFTSVTGQK